MLFFPLRNILGTLAITPTLSLLLLLAVLCACKRLEPNPERNIKVIGHGGVGFQSPRNQLPHNSIESLRKAMEFYDAHGVEIDIYSDFEGNLWMYHDETLETMTDCHGCIFNQPASALQNCHFRNDFMIRHGFRKFKLQRFDEFLQITANYIQSRYVFLDIRTNHVCDPQKNSELREKLISGIVRLINQYHIAENTWLTSGDQAFIREMRAAMPDVKILYERRFSEESLRYTLENNLTGMILKNRECTAEDIQTLRNNNLISCIFGIKVQTGITQAVNKNPDFIMPDNLGLTANILQR